MPPSTASTVPVVAPASGLARYAMAAATSSAVTSRPVGWRAARAWSSASGSGRRPAAAAPRGVGGARVDTAHPDALGQVIGGHGQGEGLHGALGGAVQGPVGQPDAGRNRAGVDHHRIRRGPQEGQGGPGHPDDPEDVDVEHLVPLAVGVGLDGAGGADAGVVDHDVEAAQPLGGLADRRPDRGVVGPVGADLLQRRLRGGRGHVQAGHPGAPGGQQPGGGQADARGAAGDQRPQAGELGVGHGTATFRSGPSGYAQCQEALTA
jgi:hypothetical protein